MRYYVYLGTDMLLNHFLTLEAAKGYATGKQDRWEHDMANAIWTCGLYRVVALVG